MWSPGGHVRGLPNTFLCYKYNALLPIQKGRMKWMNARKGRGGGGDCCPKATCPAIKGRSVMSRDGQNAWQLTVGYRCRAYRTRGAKQVVWNTSMFARRKHKQTLKLLSFYSTTPRDPKRAYLFPILLRYNRRRRPSLPLSHGVITDRDDTQLTLLSHLTIASTDKTMIAQVLYNVVHQIIQWEIKGWI